LFVLRNCKEVVEKDEFRVSCSLVLVASGVRSGAWLSNGRSQFHIRSEVMAAGAVVESHGSYVCYQFSSLSHQHKRYSSHEMIWIRVLMGLKTKWGVRGKFGFDPHQFPSRGLCRDAPGNKGVGGRSGREQRQGRMASARGSAAHPAGRLAKC